MRRSASSPLEWEQAASMGELARPLVHEVNNFLNTIMLQLAAMQPGLPPQFADDLQVIRRRGKQLAQLVQQWQRQPRCEKPSTRTNLKELLETLVQERSWKTEGPDAILSLVPPDKPLTVAGAVCD